jgi:hypothetical protein
MIGFNVPVNAIELMRAMLVPTKKMSSFREEIRSLLLSRYRVHPGAVQRWSMNWLTVKFTEEEVRLFIGKGFTPDVAAKNISDRIRSYSDARYRADMIIPVLVENYDIAAGVVDRWLIEREEFSLCSELQEFVSGGAFDAERAASAIASKLKPISEELDRALRAGIEESEERANWEAAEMLAQREAKRRKIEIFEELQAMQRKSKENDSGS